MAKVDYAKEMELQRLLKENSTLKNKIEMLNGRENVFKEKISELEKGSTSNSGTNLKLEDIKFTNNIRDHYEYEEIDLLAKNILEQGQLQPVLLTQDKYLLAGYRRYHAIKYLQENRELFNGSNIPEEIKVVILDRSLEDIGENKVDEIQYAENDQRKSIDNFQLCTLFNRYLDKGFDQKYICEKFGKKKPFVSSIVSLKKIDNPLVTWVKEFQNYAWSKKKFNELIAINSEELDDLNASFYEKNKGIIGWQSLYNIAKQPNIISQKKEFLKLFKNRLSKEELDSDYFKEVESIPKEKPVYQEVLKHQKSMKVLLSKLEQNYSSEEAKKVTDDMNKYLGKLDSLLNKLSKLS